VKYLREQEIKIAMQHFVSLTIKFSIKRPCFAMMNKSTSEVDTKLKRS